MTNAFPYDAILVLSFGGPEKRDDVIPFLENVLRGKPVPRERLLEVAEHYYHYDGVSPINQQCRELIARCSRNCSPQESACQSTGVIATGTRCCLRHCSKCTEMVCVKF